MSTVVTLPYDPLWKPVEWAKENCPSYITNTMRNTGKPGQNIIAYYFGNAQDATLFAPRWK